jgi:hypothetical protein
MIPFDNGAAKDSYFGVAIEDGNGFAGNWTMNTWAICGSGVTGWQKVSNTASGAVALVGVGASCPAGKKVIGTGANIQGNVNFTFLDTIQPGVGLGSVWAEAAREEGVPPTTEITVTAHAICVNPVPGQQLVSVTSSSDSVSPKHARVLCPSGTRLHGTGASITSAGGQAWFDRIGLFGAGAVGGADTEVREDETGFAGNWTATAFAICAI